MVGYRRIQSTALRLLILALVLGLFLPSTSGAKWKKIAQFAGAPNVFPSMNSCFFFNKTRGFIGIDGQTGLMRTYDGKTWLPCTIPFGYTAFDVINDIQMIDSLNGWAAVEGDKFAHGLWQTTDGGVSWQENTSFAGSLTSVYRTPTTLLFSSRYTLPKIGISTTNGASFFGISPYSINDINFVDELHGVASVFDLDGSGLNLLGSSMWTDDGGINWFTNNVTTESWSVYAKKGTSTFVMAGEGYFPDPLNFTAIQVSQDYGHNFTIISTVPGRPTGHITGVGDVLYLQENTPYQKKNNPPGLYRSIDGGHTWKPVGGPSNWRDTRFWVGGCIGELIIASDEYGGIYMSEDGGDGELHEGPHNPNLYPAKISLTANTCNFAKGQVIFSNYGCGELIVDSIYFIDSTDPAIQSGALSFNKTHDTSYSLGLFQNDTLSFSWNPGLLSSAKNLTSFQVRIHSRLPDSTTFFDTTVTVDVSSFANQPTFSLTDTSFHLDSVNICSGMIDTVFSLTNHGCDTLELVDTSFFFSSDWTVLDKANNPVVFPIQIPTDSTLSLRVRYSPRTTGNQSGKIILHLNQKGVTKDTAISLSGSSYRIVSVVTPTTLSLPALSVCNTMDTLASLTNNSCDTLVIDSLFNTDLVTFAFTNGLSLPLRLAPDSTLTIPIRFFPKKNSSSDAQLTYKYHIATDSGVSFTALHGDGLPGSGGLVCSPPTSSVIFPDRFAYCSQSDSISFKIFNPGCDSVIIQSITFSGASVPALSCNVNPKLPSLLLNSSSFVAVTVTVDPTITSLNDGIITIRYTLPDGSTKDTSFAVHALIKYSNKLASIDHKTLDLGTMSLCKTLFDTVIIQNTDCPDVHITSTSITGIDYSIVQSPITPKTLGQLKTDTVIIMVSPRTSGPHTGLLSILTDDDLAPLKTVSYTVNVLPKDHVNFRLEQVNKDIVASDSGAIDVIPDLDWKGKNLTALNYSLVYNEDLLWYADRTEAFSTGTQIFVTPIKLPNHQEQLNIAMTSPTEIMLKKDSPVARFYFRTAVTDTVRSTVSLELLKINNGDPDYETCVLSSDATNTDFSVQFVCGDPIIQSVLQGKPLLIAGAPHPNPTTESTKTIELPYTTYQSGMISLSVFDQLGRTIYTDESAAKEGSHSFSVPVEKLPSGELTYILNFTGSARAAARNRMIVLH